MAAIERMLGRLIRKGQLRVISHDGKVTDLGTAEPGRGRITIRLADRGVALAIARHPRLGLAEAYMDGHILIEEGDIAALIDLARYNGRWEDGTGNLGAQSPLKRHWGNFRARFDKLNWEAKSRRNVAHHYDLGNRLYDLFLDADRQYSCAYFTGRTNSLEQAQTDKKAHIAAKLALKPGQRVLDIGCGWGGMALYLNRVADVDVLGVTLSEEQLKTARERAAAAGVSDRVKFELIDYRKVAGVFDRIVSVGMFEHVGPPHYRQFFLKCRSLLAQDGVMLLHTIGRMGGPGTTDPFTTRYIFPGGYNPALSEIIAASESVKLIASDVETLRLHYALTIRHWYDRTVAAREAIVALYDERFYRMWTFYLAGAMGAFNHGGMCNYQIQYIRRRDTLPITRDYLAEAETGLRARG